MLDIFSPEVVYFDQICATYERCGSRITCDPPPTDTDEDWLVVLPASKQNIVSDCVRILHECGYLMDGSVNEHYQNLAENTFMSWRKGDTNLIITANAEFARRHRAATHACKVLNIQNKQHRITVFQAVLYANKWEPI